MIAADSKAFALLLSLSLILSSFRSRSNSLSIFEMQPMLQHELWPEKYNNLPPIQTQKANE